MLKAAGETGTLWMAEVCNALVKDGKVPQDWSRSWMVNVYRGKGDALTCGSYRGIKLLEHALKVLERVIDGRLRKIVKIDSMQFGFMSGRSRTEAIFIVRQMQKYLAKSKDLWMAFVDLEKAFDRVPREVVWWVLRYLGIDDWIVSVIKAMYEDASTKVRMNGRESRAFNVKVGVHQGSVLSPLLFIIVLEALSREFREGLPTCFFHTRQLRSIRRSLTVDSSHALVRALILMRLDYCNGLLGGAPKCLLSPLSRVMWAAARLILLLPRTSSVENEIRTVLHWLDVPARVTFKLACSLIGVFMGRLRLTWSVTSHRSALSLDALISVRPPRACCLCPDRRRQQSDLGLLPSPPLLHGTVSRSIFVIPGSALWFSASTQETYLFSPSGYLSS